MSKSKVLFALGKAFAISFNKKREKQRTWLRLHLTTFSFNLEFIWKSEKLFLIITCPVTAAAQKVAFLCTWEGNQAAAFWCNSCWSCLFPPFPFPAVFLPQHLWNACSHSGVCNHRLEPFPDAFGHFCHNAGSHPLEQPWRNQFLIFFSVPGRSLPSFVLSSGSLLWSFVLFLSFHILACVNVILIALLPETVNLFIHFHLPGSSLGLEWGFFCWCGMSGLLDASWKARHLQADGHPVMLQNQVTFHSPGHKNRLSLLQLKEKVQEDKHRHCAGLTTCPGD